METAAKHKRTGQPALSRCLGTLLYWIAPPWPWRGWIDDERKVPPAWEPAEAPNNCHDDLVAILPDPRERMPGSDVILAWLREWHSLTPSEVEERLPAVKEALAARGPVLAALRTCTGRPYATGLPPSLEATFQPPTGQCRDVAWTAEAAALVHHVEGRDDEALKMLEDASALGASLANGEALLRMIVAGACLSSGCSCAARVIVNGSPSDEALRSHMRLARELRVRLAPLPKWLTWQAACAEVTIGETRWGQPLGFEEAGTEVTPEGTTTHLRYSAVATLAAVLKRHYSLAWLRDRCARLIEEAEKPTAERDLAAVEERAKHDARARRDLIALSELPSATHHEAMLATAEARLAGDEIVSALELHRREHGEYPEALGALVRDYLPDLPPDPFTGGELVYRREAVGYTLYSVGRNKADDDGTYRSSRHESPDLVLVGGRCLERDGEAE
jgi:hypothetical protein